MGAPSKPRRDATERDSSDTAWESGVNAAHTDPSRLNSVVGSAPSPYVIETEADPDENRSLLKDGRYIRANAFRLDAAPEAAASEVESESKSADNTQTSHGHTPTLKIATEPHPSIDEELVADRHTREGSDSSPVTISGHHREVAEERNSANPTTSGTPAFAASAADREIAVELNRLLRENLRKSAKGISYCVSRGQVVLHGEVNSYYFKQLAQEFALRIRGVKCVSNRIEVSSAK